MLEKMSAVERCIPLALDYEFDPKHLHSSARTILERFHPDWSSRLDIDSLQIEVVAGGYTNTLLVAYFSSSPSEKVLIRVYGKDTDVFIDREAEVRTLHLLSENNVAGEVYGLFANGMCYEYVPGQVLDRSMAFDPHISALIAREMVQLHCVYRKPGPHPQISLFDKMDRMLHESYTDTTTQDLFRRHGFPTKAKMQDEIEFLRSGLMSGKSPLVFCHNDLFYRNILYDDQADKVKFIDFEYAGVNYQAYDIGNFFNELCGVDDLDYARFPSRDWQLKFLTTYLLAWNESHGVDSENASPSSSQLEELYLMVNKFSSVAHFFWIIWCFQQAKSSSIDFDYVQYGRLRLDEYQRRKDERFAA